MKFYYFLLIFILLSFNTNAYWQTYQNDLRNTGISNGTGYFPLTTVNFNDDNLGFDFQPLVADLDNNGSKEIVIFSNSSLIIFNHQLMILKQSKVGDVLAQPALFDFDDDKSIEIIFNARQNSTDYFFAYQYNNSNLRQEFNITLSNEADFGGIKCVKLEAINACVFKDKKNYINVINMNSKTINSSNTSVYEETRHTVPAIGDIDNDGNPEAVFWFNEDNSSGYGFLVFDLAERRLDPAFNNSGIVDNIFSPTILGPSLFHQLFELKGQPVLVDLNNDNKLEIAASVFYDDSNDLFTGNDWFTELFVYSHNGTRLFSRCELNPLNNNWCGLTTEMNKWEGTNPLAMDYDKNGIDNICFVKDVKNKIGAITFSHMALSCYNYNGDNIAEVMLEGVGSSIRGTAIAADMNNDGYMDIISSNSINLANGSSILYLPLNTTSPIVDELDGNNGLDLIWTVSSQTKVFLDNNNYSIDLSVNSLDVTFSKLNKTHIIVNSIIKNNGQVEVNNIKTIIYNTETLENNTALLSIRRNGNVTFSSILGLKENEKVMISVDYDNEINESDEANNVAFKEFSGLPYVFVSADLEPFNINSEFQNYIKNKLTSAYYTTNENEADVKVYIGKNNPINAVNNVRTLDEFEFGYDFGNIIYNDKVGTMPYSSLVGAFKDSNGKIIIMIVGNEIEGDIAGVKEFIKNQALFLGTADKNSIFVDDENIDAVKVFDYLHLGGNNEHYMQQTEQFKDIVKRALNDSMFTEINYNITTSNNIVLRMRNLKSNLSEDYLLYLNSTNDVFMPVVMSGGIWADISAWQDLGSELSSNGRDVWLIEITGGPNIECDSCINYNHTDLVDDFWPALIGAIQKLSGKDKIQYVAHSNGCRTALDSLSNWSSSGKTNVGKVIYNGSEITFDMLSNPVETFIGVACPGNFSELSYFARLVNDSGDIAIKRLENKNRFHPKFGDVAHELESVSGEIVGVSRFFGNPKISLNLFKYWYTLIKSDEDKQPGDGLNFNYFTLIYGTDGFLFSKTDDQIVAVKDELEIYDKVNSPNKKLISVAHKHTGMTEDKSIKSNVKKSLDKSIYS